MYHLFAWDYREAVGGLNEYEGSYDDILLAKKEASKVEAGCYEIVKQEDGKTANLIVVLTGSGKYENDNPPTVPAPKDWDWGEFVIDWEIA